MAAAVTLAERAPYSGMEYGYYHGVVAPEFAPALSVDVLYPGCLTGESDEVSIKSHARDLATATFVFLDFFLRPSQFP